MIPAQTETLAANPNATSTPSAGGSAGGGGGSGNRNGDGNSHGGGGRRQDPQNPAWVRIRTPNSGRIYFHNEGTQRTTWTLPAGSQFREYGDAGPGAGATQDDGESTRRAANDISGKAGGRLVRHQAAAAKTTKIVRKLKKKATKTPSLKPSPQQQTTQPSKDQNHRRQQPRPEPQSQSRPKSRPQPQPQPQLQPQREQLSRPRESFPSQGEAAASSSGCCRPFKVPWTIWLLWLLPTLVSITVNLYYKQVAAILSLEESAELAVKQQQMLRKMFTLFDDVEELVYTSLRSNSYPQFVQSTIGAELRKLLEAGAHTV